MRKSSSRSRSGFTLIEMLTVIVIIGMLAAILLPVLGRTKDRTYDLAAKDLCGQVATAWSALLDSGGAGRFPSRELLSAVGSATPVDGDLMVEMGPGTTSVLSWWQPSGPVPASDLKTFKVYLSDKAGTALLPAALKDPDPTLVDRWPSDVRLDRSFVQKCVGLYAPWAERAFAEPLEKQLTPTFEDDDLSSTKDLAQLKNEYSDALLCAVLDYDGDGKVTLPEDVAGLAGTKSVRTSAAVWVRSKDKKRLLTSW